MKKAIEIACMVKKSKQECTFEGTLVFTNELAQERKFEWISNKDKTDNLKLDMKIIENGSEFLHIVCSWDEFPEKFKTFTFEQQFIIAIWLEQVADNVEELNCPEEILDSDIEIELQGISQTDDLMVNDKQYNALFP